MIHGGSVADAAAFLQAINDADLVVVNGAGIMTDAFRESAHRNAHDFETLGSAEVAKTYGNSPNRIAFKVKDPRGFSEFMEALARHDAQGSAHTQRGFQGGRPSIYAFEDGIRRLTLPALIIVGDEDDACIEPSLFLKQTIPASGLASFRRRATF
jgi:proline iminopeptidase